MRKFIATVLAIQMGFPICAAAQQQPQTTPVPAMIAGSLHILVLEGEGAVNNVETHQGTVPVVEVRDENDRPVEGATVVFRLPPAGPGALFPGQALSKTARTGLQGQAIATGMTPNSEVGRFKIHVTATMGNKLGEIDILQTNSPRTFAAHQAPPRKLPSWWKWAAAGVVGAAVVGIILATTGKSSSSNPTVSITPDL